MAALENELKTVLSLTDESFGALFHRVILISWLPNIIDTNLNNRNTKKRILLSHWFRLAVRMSDESSECVATFLLLDENALSVSVVEKAFLIVHRIIENAKVQRGAKVPNH